MSILSLTATVVHVGWIPYTAGPELLFSQDDLLMFTTVWPFGTAAMPGSKANVAASAQIKIPCFSKLSPI